MNRLFLEVRRKFLIGEEKYIAKKSDVVFIPAGIPHSYKTMAANRSNFFVWYRIMRILLKCCENCNGDYCSIKSYVSVSRL